MGTLEERNRRSIRRTEVQEAILSTVALAGVISVSLVAPKVLSILKKAGIIPYLRKDDVVRSAASRLRKKGLLKFENDHYSLTPAGEITLKKWQMADYLIKRPSRWDGKWRVVIFDIPEKMRSKRTQARQILSKAGFYRLQDSVWIYPYDCEDVIGLMKVNLRIGKYLLYMIVDQVENDTYLRSEFNLFKQ